MDGVGGLAGWRWIFILEGLVTILLSIMATFILPGSISSAKFLTEEEREFARKTIPLSAVLLFYLIIHSASISLGERVIHCPSLGTRATHYVPR